MLKISLIDLAKVLGTRYQGKANIIPEGVAIDSRKVKPGDLFFALPGENYNGEDFVEEAFAQGALGAVISDSSPLKNLRHKNLVLCRDPLETLQQMAKLIRENSSVWSVGITGSTGKTTTKDFLSTILEQKFKTVKNEGNYNNELGLPLTLCQLDKTHQALVVEMGMRGLGQIDFLCKLAQPHSGIITNIGLTHAEILGSQEKIAEAKSELISNLADNGLAVLNYADQKRLENFLPSSKRHILWYGYDKQADFRIKEIIKTTEMGTSFILEYEREEYPIELSIPGEHNVLNATAAIAIAKNLGLDWSQIKRGLANTKSTELRLEIKTNSKGIKIINDTYNANPDSMEAALKVLKNVEGKRKIAILGDMYELGVYEEEGHQKVGRLVHSLNFDLLVVVGHLAPLIARGAKEAGMEESKVLNFWTKEEALSNLEKILYQDDVILVKGSRGMKMEKIVQELMG